MRCDVAMRFAAHSFSIVDSERIYAETHRRAPGPAIGLRIISHRTTNIVDIVVEQSIPH